MAKKLIKKAKRDEKKRVGCVVKRIKVFKMRGSKINTTVGLRECLSVHKLQLTSKQTHTHSMYIFKLNYEIIASSYMLQQSFD